MTRFSKASAIETYEDSRLIQVISWMLFVGLLAALITIAIVNIKPYTVVAASVTANSTWVYSLPLIGWIFRAMSIGVEHILAIIIWIPVQILECLWLVIALDAKAQKAAIRQSYDLSRDVAVAKGGGRETRAAARRISKIPFFFIKWAAMLALGAYTFDLVVGMRAYPVWKDWDSFQMWTKSMDPMWINFQSLQDLAMMLFSFEAVLVLVLVVGQWVMMRSGGDSDA